MSHRLKKMPLKASLFFATNISAVVIPNVLSIHSSFYSPGHNPLSETQRPQGQYKISKSQNAARGIIKSANYNLPFECRSHDLQILFALGPLNNCYKKLYSYGQAGFGMQVLTVKMHFKLAFIDTMICGPAAKES